MKKISLLVMSVLLIGVLTGCEKEDVVTTTTCTKQGAMYNNTTRLIATNEKIEKVEINYVYENSAMGITSFNDVTDDQKEQIKNNMLNTLGFDDTTYEGFSIDIYFDDQMKVDMVIELETVDQDVLDALGLDFSNTNLNINDAVQSYKDTGFICE